MKCSDQLYQTVYSIDEQRSTIPYTFQRDHPRLTSQIDEVIQGTSLITCLTRRTPDDSQQGGRQSLIDYEWISNLISEFFHGLEQLIMLISKPTTSVLLDRTPRFQTWQRKQWALGRNRSSKGVIVRGRPDSKGYFGHSYSITDDSISSSDEEGEDPLTTAEAKEGLADAAGAVIGIGESRGRALPERLEFQDVVQQADDTRMRKELMEIKRARLERQRREQEAKDITPDHDESLNLNESGDESSDIEEVEELKAVHEDEPATATIKESAREARFVSRVELTDKTKKLAFVQGIAVESFDAHKFLSSQQGNAFMRKFDVDEDWVAQFEVREFRENAVSAIDSVVVGLREMRVDIINSMRTLGKRRFTNGDLAIIGGMGIRQGSKLLGISQKLYKSKFGPLLKFRRRKRKKKAKSKSKSKSK